MRVRQFRGNSRYPGDGKRQFPHNCRPAAPGEAVETEFGAVEVSHVCLNDGVVEGLRCRDVPAFTVQYHPEAAAGPHDADYLFDRFVDLMGDER